MPERPSETGGHRDTIRKLMDWYMRTNPTTGEVSAHSVYPNNATAENISKLISFLYEVTNEVRAKLIGHYLLDMNTAALIPGFSFLSPTSHYEKIWNENERWNKRLGFYRKATIQAKEDNPGVMPGNGEDPVSKAFTVNVISPLFFGWYPNDIEPFASQPSPFGSQVAQGGPDIQTPFVLAHQVELSKSDIIDNMKAFTKDLGDQAIDLAETGLGALYVAAAFVGTVFAFDILTRRRW